MVAAITVVMLSAPLSAGGAAAEHGLAGVPRRQAVDLGAHDALEEIRRPRRQFKRTKQETGGLEHDLDPASLQDRREIGRGERAIRECDPRRHIVRLDRRLDGEAALVVFDQPDHARRHQAVETGRHRGGHAAGPCAEDRADAFKLLHPGKALCGAAPPSEALRHDNTRYGSAPLSRSRITASAALCRPLAASTPIVIR